MSTIRQAGRLLKNMRLAKQHADALESYDQRPPEWTFANVDRKVLRAAVRFLREIGGEPQGKQY